MTRYKVRLDIPEESRLVDYADDVATLVGGRAAGQAQSRLSILTRRVSGWMTVQVHSFQLGTEKRPKLSSRLCNSKMSFFEQADKVVVEALALSRLIAYIRVLRLAGNGF